VDGTIDLTSGGQIGLTSDQDLKLKAAKGKEDVSLTTTGSISNESGTKEDMITGKNVELNAISGTESDGSHNAGEKDNALNIEATGLGGTADNLFVNNSNTGNTELSDIFVNDEAVLNFNGDLSQKQDAVLAADKLRLSTTGELGRKNDDSEPQDKTAPGISTSVDIGKKSGAITVNADDLSLTGNSVNIHSLAPNAHIEVSGREGISITAAGNLVPGDNNLLDGRELYLYGLGNLGTPFESFLYNGTLVRCDTVYGMMNVKPVTNIVYRQPVPAMTFIRTEKGGALGYFPANAKLILTGLKPVGTDKAADLLRKASTVDGFLTGYNVRIVLPNGELYNGYAVLMLEVENQPDAEVVYALYYRDGKLEVLKGFIRDGYAVFSVFGFSKLDDASIAIVTEEALEELGLSVNDVVSVETYTGAYDYCLDLLANRKSAA